MTSIETPGVPQATSETGKQIAFHSSEIEKYRKCIAIIETGDVRDEDDEADVVWFRKMIGLHDTMLKLLLARLKLETENLEMRARKAELEKRLAEMEP
jgi:hypothetical protein